VYAEESAGVNTALSWCEPGANDDVDKLAEPAATGAVPSDVDPSKN
jgi:hypothetical protein